MTTGPTLAGHLAAAWARWDRLPGDPTSARLLEEAVQATAGTLDTTGSTLRDEVNFRRRAGMGLARALTDVLAPHERKAAA
jgi:hypothetical protein